MANRIGELKIPPTAGQLAADFAGNAAQSGKPFVTTNVKSYAGVGIPVYNNGGVSASVGAFKTYGRGPSSTGYGAGVRFNF